ncbi:hypothetical protein [Methylobacterium brachythecii]|uniref:WGR domain-containing protein n=1 Tax=Methylobacterium brachythecii TaxID=1176177 RepID=A0A7W6AJJ1_9HYPH|nr:hypothetical protein [Methylobacterium brachythecii]MBB3902505.1 hypothetical protein [Methylobacterium brachythecii]GLS42352.1 hypothetical protein GCM10007884_03370 [Methylobacterium brachythecii]
MQIVRSARLWFKGGTSDKVYEVDLVENDGLVGDARYLVNFRYGRRGASLREGTKTTSPATRESAERTFDSVVVSKINEGYRRTDQAAAGTDDSSTPERSGSTVGGRERELIARLDAALRSPWPVENVDRLLWRIGEVRIRAATAGLLDLARKAGREASYSLVFALARAGGAEAAPALRTIAHTASSRLVGDLAGFALVSSLVGDAREIVGLSVPDNLARASESRDVDAMVAALSELAAPRDAARATDAGRALVALAQAAQSDAPLRDALAAVILRMPARPPYLIGLRKIYKYAEMADDAVLFAAVAHRFETATPMYRAGHAYRGQVYVPELRRRVNLAEVQGRDHAPVGLADATLHYFKRRIWRTLRKRGELGDPSFAELAAAYLLTLRESDLARPTTWTHFVKDAGGRWSREQRSSGPLAKNWTASQLLQRNDPRARARLSSLSFAELPSGAEASRPEAFSELWQTRPDLGLRLAGQSPIPPVGILGVRVLKANPDFIARLSSAQIGELLTSAHAEVLQLGFEEARNRLAGGAVDEDLLAMLLRADLVEARRLAADRISREPNLPWSGLTLAFAALTAFYADLDEPVLGWARERRLGKDVAKPLADEIVAWLLAKPGEPSDAEAAVIRTVRGRLRHLWADGGMPLGDSEMRRLLAHPAPAVVAAGIDLLGLSGIDPGTLPDGTWRELLGSPSEDVQEAALTLFGGLGDEDLARHAPLVLAFATSGSTRLRQAARPLVARIASREPAAADRLARELIDTLFATAPDDDYPADIVALLREAMPGQLAALDTGMVWRLLQARAKGAQLLGAELLGSRSPENFSVRQIARLGNHGHLSVRNWAMAAYEAAPQRFQAEAQDAVLLVESEWPEIYEFARKQFDSWPPEVWTPATLAVVTDSVKPEVLAFARHLLRSRLKPEDAEAQLTRLLEHPAQSMHLLVSEMLIGQAQSEAAFGKLMPLARIVMLQVLKGRVAKDRVAAFLKAEALRDRARAEAVLPLFSDLTLSGTERDRTQAVLTLRDITLAHPGLAASLPIGRRPAENRSTSRRPTGHAA